MNMTIQRRCGGHPASAPAISRLLTATDLYLCLVPIGLFLSIMSLV